MGANDDNQEALRRKFEAIKIDRDALLQRIAERATAFSDDPAEQRDYRSTLIRLLVSHAVQPLYGPDADARAQADALLAKLRAELRERAAQRKRIKQLLTDLNLAIDDAFDV